MTRGRAPIRSFALASRRAAAGTIVLAALALAGCATAPRGQAPAPRPLAPPATAGEHAASQVVRGSVGARDMTMNCVVSVKQGVMSVVGLNATGVRLFTISYDGDAVKFEKSVDVPEMITADRLLADLQLVYWPIARLRETLRPAGYEIADNVPGTRRLRRGDRLVAEVHYTGDDAWNGRAWLVSLEFGYTLQIDSEKL